MQNVLNWWQQDSQSSHLEKKQTLNSWKRHALCDSVLSYDSWTCYKEQYGERNMVDLKLWTEIDSLWSKLSIGFPYQFMKSWLSRTDSLPFKEALVLLVWIL